MGCSFGKGKFLVTYSRFRHITGWMEFLEFLEKSCLAQIIHSNTAWKKKKKKKKDKVTKKEDGNPFILTDKKKKR